MIYGAWHEIDVHDEVAEGPIKIERSLNYTHLSKNNGKNSYKKL